MHKFFVVLFAPAAISGIAFAQTIPVTDPAFVRAALVVTTFDRLHGDCRKAGGFDRAQSAKVNTWQADNGVAAIRARMTQLTEHPSLAQQVDKAASAIVQRVYSEKTSVCAAAVSVSQLPDAQFAKISPQLLADASPPAEADQPAPAPAPPPASPARSTAPPQQVLARIDSFGFDTRAKMGVGGFVTLDIYPVVLMKSGEALTDVKALSAPEGLDAHRRAHPEHWTRWRREGGKLQLEKKKGWEPLPFQTTYAQWPEDMRLEGLYRDLEGVGTGAVGGSQSVTAYDEYRFGRDGSVERSGGAGSTAESGDTSVATSVRKRVRKGRYTIDGLTLRIRYEDGSSEQRILIADPKKPGGAIWLDGAGYVKR